jgi:hypothetical protein
MPENSDTPVVTFYCPACARPAERPLRCGDCGSLICSTCGTPLESADDLGVG